MAMGRVEFDLTGRVALVTGGTRGVGRGITESFLGSGAEVMICARNAPEALPAARGREAAFMTADVRDWDSVGSVISQVVERFGRLDVVVNNAGGSPPAATASASPRFSSAIITLNLIAPLLMAQRANEVMQQQESGGVVINISSLSGMRPSPGTAAYGAAKAGLINLTESLAVEFAPKVRVNCVTAGALDTPELHHQYGGDAYFSAVAATIPLGRMGRPDDIAQACLFLASDAATFVTGSNLVVHGGGDSPPPPAAV
jgi:NAD(P)-dependent dehydrogenase (short-subunit alcohol dehydrogenase family)